MGTTWQRPEAINTRLVFLCYSLLAGIGGLAVYLWPSNYVAGLSAADPHLDGIAWGRYGLVRTAAAAVTAWGAISAALSTVDNPVSRRRLLYWFAGAHLLFGLMFLIQWLAIFEHVLTQWAAWTPLVAGVVFLYLAMTASGLEGPVRRAHVLLGPADRTPGRSVMVDARFTDAATLRSQYEDQIRQAARREERARLARDLHDAVKQQLFVIQTSAATAGVRYGTDDEGARAAIDAIRTAAREAIVEMEAMIEGLEAVPAENAGLVEAIRKQCEALRFRTGAEVTFDVGTLPPESALAPGVHDALFRAAQEALANVGRHARAHRVTVRLGLEQDRLDLSIRDDGAGFDVVEGRRGMGLRNLGERATELGGSLSVQSHPGGGTIVRVSVPCRVDSPRDYARRAVLWTAMFTALVAPWVMWGFDGRPWTVAVAAVMGITAARYAVGWYRVRRQAGARA